MTRTEPKLKGARGVYKRGGVWIAVVEHPRDPKTGKRKRTWLRGFQTRKDAERARDRARSDLSNGIDVAPEKLTVAGLVTRWLADAETRVGAKTHEEYKSLAERCIIPHIGSILLTKLRPMHVQETYTVLLVSGRVERQTDRAEAGSKKPATKKRGLSPTTVRHAHGLLKGILAWAVRMQILARNVADAVDPPARTHIEADSLTNEEIARILEAATGTPWETAIVLALGTGMRRGEVMALRWDAVDFEASTVTVRASMSQTRAGVSVKSTKTGRVRTIPMAPLVATALRERRQAYLAERLAAGASYADQGHVVADPFGQPPTPYALTDAFREIAKKAKVKKRLHDARHTFASILIGSGVDVRTAATLLGHANPNVTLAVYSHQIVGLKEEAVAKVGSHLDDAIARRRTS